MSGLTTTNGQGSSTGSTEQTSEKTAQNDSVVGFDSKHDRYNPINWSKQKKVYTSVLYSLTSFGSVWASTA